MRTPDPDFTLDLTFMLLTSFKTYPSGSMALPTPALTCVLTFIFDDSLGMSTVWVHAGAAAVRIHGSATTCFDLGLNLHVVLLFSRFHRCALRRRTLRSF